MKGAGLAEVDAVVVLPLEQPVISIALIATAANNHLVDMASRSSGFAAYPRPSAGKGDAAP